MAIEDLYSKRKKRLERAGQPDVYQYDNLPAPFRVQVAHIWLGAIGRYIDTSRSYSALIYDTSANQFWARIRNQMCQEKGVFSLVPDRQTPEEECINYLLTADLDGALDIIEFSFEVIDRFVRREPGLAGATQGADEAISDLNQRFKEHAIGYQYTGGMIIKVDSQFLHAEAVRPALALLNEAGFRGPDEEFINAFEHYRHGRNKEAIAEALKAFESTMKSICSARNWPFPNVPTAKPLLDLPFQKELIPDELKGHFGTFRAAMESGLPTLSNRTSRHGAGPKPTSVPPHFVAYALHLCAANIVFLMEAHKAKR